MPEIFKVWAMSLAGIIVFASLCETILPSGSYKKYLHLTIGIVLVLALISPFTKNRAELDFSIATQREAYKASTDMSDFQKEKVMKIYKDKLASRLDEELESKTGQSVDVIIEVSEAEDSFGRIERLLITTEDSSRGKISEGAIEELCHSFGVDMEAVGVKYIKGLGE